MINSAEDYTVLKEDNNNSKKWNLNNVMHVISCMIILGLSIALISMHIHKDNVDPGDDSGYEFNRPWDIEWSSEGDLFFTEQCRGLSVLSSDGTTTLLWGLPGIGALMEATDMFCESQSGVLGLALDPDFGDEGSRHYRDIYVFFASSFTEPRRNNRVARITLADDIVGTPKGRVDIVTGMYYKIREVGAGAHSGGRIRFGLPGTIYADYLFITQGDNHNATLSQDTWAIGGAVLAVDRDGEPMPTNELGVNSLGDSRMFAYGFRNVQGIAFRGDQAYICEHGPEHQDEVTRLVNGGNGGWDPHNRSFPCDEYDYCGYGGTAETMPMTDLHRFPDAMRPVWDNNGVSEGMAPCVFLRGSQWGDYEGWLAVGFLFGQRIDLLDIAENGTLRSVHTPALAGKRFRSIINSPHGGVTVATDQHEIYEIDVATLTNDDVPSGDQCVYLPEWHAQVYGCTTDSPREGMPTLETPDFHYWGGCTCA